MKSNIRKKIKIQSPAPPWQPWCSCGSPPGRSCTASSSSLPTSAAATRPVPLQATCPAAIEQRKQVEVGVWGRWREAPETWFHCHGHSECRQVSLYLGQHVMTMCDNSSERKIFLKKPHLGLSFVSTVSDNALCEFFVSPLCQVSSTPVTAGKEDGRLQWLQLLWWTCSS